MDLRPPHSAAVKHSKNIHKVPNIVKVKIISNGRIPSSARGNEKKARSEMPTEDDSRLTEPQNWALFPMRAPSVLEAATLRISTSTNSR